MEAVYLDCGARRPQLKRNPLGGVQEVLIATDDVEITIRRLTGYPDRLRSYKIKIDGIEQGFLRPRETLTLSVRAGAHTLSAAIDWCGSNQLPFQAVPGKPLTFECGNSLRGWRLLLVSVYVLFRKNEYLWVRPAA